jgi:hypothetical protein
MSSPYKNVASVVSQKGHRSDYLKVGTFFLTGSVIQILNPSL